VLIVPFDERAGVIRMKVDPFFQWHFANAFEHDGKINVDYVRYQDFSSNDHLRDVRKGILDHPLGGQLHRATIDPGRRTFRSEARSNLLCEFPQVGSRRVGRQHRWIYASTTGPGPAASGEFLDQLALVCPDDSRSELISFGEGTFPSEAIFVARPDGRAERDGWLLSLVYDVATHTSNLTILNAAYPSEGPVARLHFDHHIPPTLHGAWASDVLDSRALAFH
jgi:all-trans-8'-apo-beta-carotenal 15,15'-oxygenase